MKYNYSFLHRPALLCLALIWLALQADFAFAQTRASGTPVQPGGSTSSTKKVIRVATAQLLSGAEIVVSPPAVSDTLNTGRQSTKQITVQNTGTDTLLFRAGALPQFAPGPGPIRVLAVFNDESMASQVPLLFARAPDIQLSVFPTFPYQGQFTAAYLAPFDVVFIGNSNPFGWAGQNTRELIGDVLADYVDTGGHVIMTSNTYFDDNPTGLAGRFVEEQYGPVLPASTVGIPGPVTLGTVVKPDHPFMQGVTSLSYEGGGAIFTLAPGAEDIAYFSNGAMLVAANPHVAAVNMSFAWDNHNQIRHWDGDIDILMQNIVHYFKASDVISVSPIRGAIAPGGQQTLDVAFDATGLDSATYTAALEIYSNATDTLVTRPLTLVVTGNGILFQPDTLKEALHKEQTSVRTFTITNNSADDHTFAVSDVPEYTTVSPLSGSIASGKSAVITVQFSSAGLGYDTYPGTITFDIDGTSWQAPISLYVFDDPVLEVNTAGLHDTLAYKDESVHTFELRNTGGSTLTYSLVLEENAMQARSAFIASVPILEEDFDGPVFPPQGWSIPSEDERTWQWNTEWILNNYDYYENFAGKGKSAMIGENYRVTTFAYNASLVTPEISTDGFRNFKVEYNASFIRNFDDSLSLEIQVDNGGWQPVLIWGWLSGQHGSYFRLPGEAVSLRLDDYIDSTATSFRLRWRYGRAFGTESFWYGQIDDVVISGERSQWLDVVPETGSIPPGGTATLMGNFDAQDHLPGVYTGQLKISSNDPRHPVVSIPASLYIKLPGTLVVSQDSITQTVALGQTVTHTLTLANTGESPLEYNFGDTPLVGAPASATIFYDTDFDGLNGSGGTIGWIGHTGQVSIVQNADGTGNFLQGVSTPDRDLLMSTPFPRNNLPEIISMRMDIGFTGSLKFKLMPGLYSGDSTAVEYDGLQDDILIVYSYDTASAKFISHQVPKPTHAGAFNLRIDLKRLTKTFDLYLDGRLAFSGMTRIANINNNLIAAENDGSFYIESFTITSGIGPEYSKTFSPVSGTLAPGASAAVDITFEPVTNVGGSYRDTLVVTGSPLDVVHIPVHFEVEQNAAPVLLDMDSVEVIEHGQQTVVFKATDADNDPVTITVSGVPAFMKLTSTNNGSTAYSIRPKQGDTGLYDLKVVVRDTGGRQDSGVFHLSVVPYGASAFHLKNARTGEVFPAFTDSVVLDVADPGYYALRLIADTKPAKVGSVKFWWDDHSANVENAAPYTLSPVVLLLARGGSHELKTQAFTRANAKGDKGTATEVVVRLVNSSAVKGFDVVKANGGVLFALDNNDVIDIHQNIYRSINIRANVRGGAVKSVVFKLNGRFYRVDNAAAYMLNGNIFGMDVPWPAKPGWYTLEAIPYSSWYGLGVAGTPVTVKFRVVNGSHGSSREAGEEDILPEESARARFSVYPVPVSDALRINLPADEEGYVRLVIHDMQGRALHIEEGDVSALRMRTISTKEAGLTTGFYYIQVQYSGGKREVRKFLKE